MTQNVELEHFSPCVGDTFTLESPGDRRDALELLEVKPLPAYGGPREQPFALLFKGPADTDLSQGMARVRHADAGVHELFLVPVGVDETGKLFEAIFN